MPGGDKQHRKQQALAALLTAATHAEAARQCDISERTLRY
jgi:hypothetical protein